MKPNIAESFRGRRVGRESWKTFGALIGIFLIPVLSRAQDYAVQWHTVAAGGGRSSAGAYQVEATIGQPNVGHATGGQYAVDGGFWSWLAVVPEPGAPVLTIQFTSTNAVLLSWPASAISYSLESTTDLKEQNWTAVPGTPTNTGTTIKVLVPAEPGNHFFRLIK